jgi:hypothetical protein
MPRVKPAPSANMRDICCELRALLVNDRFFTACIILVGTIIRLAHLAFIDLTLPFRYGGLFAEFAQQIVACDYLLPRHIPFYTDGGIPFAYPPLPFYVEAALLDVLSLPKFLVATLLPSSIAILTVPSFYFLTRALGLSIQTRLVALVAYGTMPAAFSQQIEGGGLPEAFGSLALIWLAISLAKAHKRNTIRSHCLVGLTWAICVVSSPGSAYASIPTMLIFAIAQLVSVERRLVLRATSLLAMAGLVAVAASSPYWVTVVNNHGTHVFVNSLIGQHGSAFKTLKEALGRLVAFGVSGGQFPFWWDVLILGGIAWAVLHRRWVLPAWFIIILSIPREGVWMLAVPAALLAGIGGAELFGPLLLDLGRTHLRKLERAVIFGGAAALFSMYLLLNPILAIQSLVAGDNKGPSPDAIAAMEWIRENTPAESKFIVLSHPQVKEWTPQIARRTVLNMPFGSEWEPEESRRIIRLEGLLKGCLDFDCIQASVVETMGYDDVYLYIDRDRLAELELMTACREDAGLVVFELVRQNSEVAIGHLSAP